MNAGDSAEGPGGLHVLSPEEEKVLVLLKAMAERIRARHAVLSLAAFKEAIVDSGGIPAPGGPNEGAAAFRLGAIGFTLSTTAGSGPGVEVEFLA